jgi:fermentation-respiration switch protein FrsA (DUF1100 family)
MPGTRIMAVLVPPLALLLVAAFLLAAAPRYFYRAVIKRPRRAAPREEGENWLLRAPGEELRLRSRDGLLLHARYLPPPEPGAPTVLILHGYRASGLMMEGYGRMFYEGLRCGVLIPDARGHGRSEGDYAGFGWPERLDCLGWIGKLRDSGAAGGGIFLFGLSMGAATVMMAAGEEHPPELRGVIEDCGYTSAEEELAYRLERDYHIGGIPGNFLLRSLSRLTEKRAGYRIEEASALEQLGKSRAPILFIHGEADDFVPFPMARRLYEAAPGEKELYTVPGAAHAQAFEGDPGEYRRRIAGFMERCLDPGKKDGP